MGDDNPSLMLSTAFPDVVFFLSGLSGEPAATPNAASFQAFPDNYEDTQIY